MKTQTLLLAIFIGFFTSSLTAQETIWFDANWKVSTKDNATYYRPAPEKKEKGYWIIDYYMTGVKQMEGMALSLQVDNEMYYGIVNYYHENGKKFQVVNYVEGKPDGMFSEFYETGEMKRTGEYEDGLREGMWKTFYKNGKIESRGKYQKGEKVGIWKTFYKNVY